MTFQSERFDQVARTEALFAAGASLASAQELIGYSHSRELLTLQAMPALPLEDEPFVAEWADYVSQALENGAWSVLRQVFVQSAFPIAKGVSRQTNYQRATKRGHRAAAGSAGLLLQEPDGLRLALHEGPAGHLPLIITSCRSDFVSLLQALWHKNEPVEIPDQIGAAFISGYNNWHKIEKLKEQWLIEAKPPPEQTAELWVNEFRHNIAPFKGLYQDRFVLIGPGAYSNVKPEMLGLDPQAWLARSLQLRIEHEYTHYALQRLGWPIRSHAHDELLADFRALAEVMGDFPFDWLRQFLGLGSHTNGRLNHYLGDKALSPASYEILKRLVEQAALVIEKQYQALPESKRYGPDLLVMLARFATMPLEILAAQSQHQTG